MKKIVTHGGTRHADEIAAVVLCNIAFPFVKVERTYTPSEADMEDPEVWVIDVGRQYDPEKGLFDHHQDSSLPAANILVGRALFGGKAWYQEIETRFLNYISRVDTGEVIESVAANPIPTINQLIRATNNMPEEDGILAAQNIMSLAIAAYCSNALLGLSSRDQEVLLPFDSYLANCPVDVKGWVENNFIDPVRAIDRGDMVLNANTPTFNSIIDLIGIPVAKDTFLKVCMGAQIATAEKAIEARAMWDAAKKQGQVAIWDDARHIVGWHELAEADDIRYLVTPNARGGYQITSRDSKLWPIPEHPWQTFRHNSGFLAAYPSLEQAIDHAVSMCK